MSTELVAQTYQATEPAISTPAHKMAQGTLIANEISRFIKSQGLSTNINGKEYVKVEAWVALGNMDGVYPRERDVKALEDGSYEAYVEIIDKNTGMVVGGASAICAIDEKRWKNADKYARRSMSITRATGKAFRLHYSWVMCLAGYEPTPVEEMPVIPFGNNEPKRDQPVAVKFDGNAEQTKRLTAHCHSKGLTEDQTNVVLAKMLGKMPIDLPVIIEDALKS